MSVRSRIQAFEVGDDATRALPGVHHVTSFGPLLSRCSIRWQCGDDISDRSVQERRINSFISINKVPGAGVLANKNSNFDVGNNCTNSQTDTRRWTKAEDFEPIPSTKRGPNSEYNDLNSVTRNTAILKSFRRAPPPQNRTRTQWSMRRLREEENLNLNFSAETECHVEKCPNVNENSQMDLTVKSPTILRPSNTDKRLPLLHLKSVVKSAAAATSELLQCSKNWLNTGAHGDGVICVAVPPPVKEVNRRDDGRPDSTRTPRRLGDPIVSRSDPPGRGLSESIRVPKPVLLATSSKIDVGLKKHTSCLDLSVDRRCVVADGAPSITSMRRNDEIRGKTAKITVEKCPEKIKITNSGTKFEDATRSKSVDEHSPFAGENNCKMLTKTSRIPDGKLRGGPDFTGELCSQLAENRSKIGGRETDDLVARNAASTSGTRIVNAESTCRALSVRSISRGLQGLSNFDEVRRYFSTNDVSAECRMINSSPSGSVMTKPAFTTEPDIATGLAAVDDVLSVSRLVAQINGLSSTTSFHEKLRSGRSAVFQMVEQGGCVSTPHGGSDVAGGRTVVISGGGKVEAVNRVNFNDTSTTHIEQKVAKESQVHHTKLSIGVHPDLTNI